MTTYSELSARVEESRAYDRVKLFLFINCGGIVDLTEYWIVQQKQAQVFLFDVNKPVNHRNLESPDVRSPPRRSRSSTTATANSRTAPPRRKSRSMRS